jgi:hypothetical protein
MTASKWKIEKLTELFPGNEKLFAHYRDLPERELAIVAVAALDAGLAEYLAKYFGGQSEATVKFLGLDGGDRAPCGTFSARIQLAHLLKIIPDGEVRFLDALRHIRNTMAHRVDICFSNELLKGKFDVLTSEIRNRFPSLGATSEQAEAAAGDRRFTFMYFGVVYQSMLHSLMEKLSGALPPKTI